MYSKNSKQKLNKTGKSNLKFANRLHFPSGKKDKKPLKNMDLTIEEEVDRLEICVLCGNHFLESGFVDDVNLLVKRKLIRSAMKDRLCSCVDRKKKLSKLGILEPTLNDDHIEDNLNSEVSLSENQSFDLRSVLDLDKYNANYQSTSSSSFNKEGRKDHLKDGKYLDSKLIDEKGKILNKLFDDIEKEQSELYKIIRNNANTKYAGPEDERILIIGDVWLGSIKQHWPSLCGFCPEAMCYPNLSFHSLRKILWKNVEKYNHCRTVTIICSLGLNDVIRLSIDEGNTEGEVAEIVVKYAMELKNDLEKSFSNTTIVFMDLPYINIQKVVSQIESGYEGERMYNIFSMKILKSLYLLNKKLESFGLLFLKDVGTWLIFTQHDDMKSTVNKLKEKKLEPCDIFYGLPLPQEREKNWVQSAVNLLDIYDRDKYENELKRVIILSSFKSENLGIEEIAVCPKTFLPKFKFLPKLDMESIIKVLDTYSSLKDYLLVIQLNISDVIKTENHSNCKDHKPLKIFNPMKASMLMYLGEKFKNNILKLNTRLKKMYEGLNIVFASIPNINIVEYQRYLMKIHSTSCNNFQSKLPYPLHLYEEIQKRINCDVNEINKFIMENMSIKQLCLPFWDITKGILPCHELLIIKNKLSDKIIINIQILIISSWLAITNCSSEKRKVLYKVIQNLESMIVGEGSGITITLDKMLERTVQKRGVKYSPNRSEIYSKQIIDENFITEVNVAADERRYLKKASAIRSHSDLQSVERPRKNYNDTFSPPKRLRSSSKERSSSSYQSIERPEKSYNNDKFSMRSRSSSKERSDSCYQNVQRLEKYHDENLSEKRLQSSSKDRNCSDFQTVKKPEKSFKEKFSSKKLRSSSEERSRSSIQIMKIPKKFHNENLSEKRCRSSSKERIYSHYQSIEKPKKSRTEDLSKERLKSSPRERLTTNEKRALDTLREFHEKECAQYRSNPFSHPEYQKEFQGWANYLIGNSVDPLSRAAQQQWKSYWKLELEKKFKSAWNSKKQECLSQVNTREKCNKLMVEFEKSSKCFKAASSSVPNSNKYEFEDEIQISAVSGSSDSVAHAVLSKLSAVHISECESYRLNPHKHPKHDVVKKSWEEKVQSSGVDPKSELVIKKWNAFWKKEIESYFLEDWLAKKNSCLEQLTLKIKENASTSSTKQEDATVSSTSRIPSCVKYSAKRAIDTLNILKELNKRKTLGLDHSLKILYDLFNKVDAGDASPSSLLEKDTNLILEIVKLRMERCLGNPQNSAMQRAIFQDALNNFLAMLDELKDVKDDHGKTEDILDIPRIAFATKGKSFEETISFITDALLYHEIPDLSDDKFKQIYSNVRKYQETI